MDRAKHMLELTQNESEIVSRLTVHPHRANIEPSFYEDFSLRGIHVDRIESEIVICTFKVPPRLVDRAGKLSPGAIANLVDEVGGAVVYKEALPMNVSVNISISYVSTAEVDLHFALHVGSLVFCFQVIFCCNKIDELEVSARLLGRKGSISTAAVLIKKKGTGEIVAQGRHTLFTKLASKI
ncbi:hypothetical protein Ancab_040020 [Ancistrocladus abbreviatus]